MKFEFEIDCTPEEARKFFGLPDVVPMQQALMDEVQKKLEDNISTMDPQDLVKMWMPIFTQSMGQNFNDIQKNFWSQMQMGDVSATSDKDK